MSVRTTETRQILRSSIIIAAWIVVGLCSQGVWAAELNFVLTGNATGEEAGLGLDCSYVADPPYTNPSDPDNRRLIDGDPVGDWTTTTGVNHQDQYVTFDLKIDCRIDQVALLFDRPEKPAFVEVAVAGGPEGPWQSV